MKLDGTTPASTPEGNNFNKGIDKTVLAEHREGEFPVYAAGVGAEDQIGLGAALRDGSLEDGGHFSSERANGSANNNGVGKFGMKIKKLPRLPFSGSEKKVVKDS